MLCFFRNSFVHSSFNIFFLSQQKFFFVKINVIVRVMMMRLFVLSSSLSQSVYKRQLINDPRLLAQMPSTRECEKNNKKNAEICARLSGAKVNSHSLLCVMREANSLRY